MEAPPTHGSLAGFTPRQSSYLRISPTLVLQLILYLEPHHVEWMNVGVFERILVALKDRIPLKLQLEEIGRGTKSSSGKQKREKVDVFRGTDYQMAFFFRKTNDKHVVLLKEKHLHYVTRSVPRPQPQPRQPRSPSFSLPPPPPHPHTKPSSLAHDPHTQQHVEEEENEEDALEVMGPPRKRTRLAPLARGSDDSAQPLSSALTQENKEEGLELLDHVKPEPMDEQDPLVVLSEGHLQQQQRSPSPPPPPQNSLFREESGTPFGEGEYVGSRAQEEEDGEEDGFKEEVDDDIKPQLKVSYQKFEIFNRSLVVIVEPYPPLPLSALQFTPRPGHFMNTEIRQLSASVQPRSSASATPNPFPNDSSRLSVESRANSLSVTPAPRSRGTRQGGNLFRRESTGISERGTPALVDESEEDDQLRGLREMSEVFRDGEDWGKRLEEEEEGSEEELESVEEIMRKRQESLNRDKQERRREVE
ncbi:hypothetical protein JCM5353_005218 [Sporobolomyces roseus]